MQPRAHARIFHRNVWLVMRREFVTTVARKSFWLTAFLVPVAILVLSLGTQVFAQRSVADTVLPTAGQAQGEPQMGYVDESGIIVRVPPGPDARALRSYADEALAGAALRRGQISEYYVISKDYLRTGGLTHVTKDYRPLSGANVSPLLTYALNYNLTGSEQSALRLLTPIARLDSTFVAPVQRGQAPNDSLAFAVPYAALFILFLVLVTTGGFMLTSVAKEKQNRTAEVLLVSLHPRDLMLGKILGLAGVGLLQMAVWLGVGLVALSQARHLMTSGYSLPGAFVPWALAFFLFGFLLYAAVYAALGVMASTVREASQLVYVALVPLIVPLVVSSTLIAQPHGSLSVALSLFPLTSPVAMVTRLASTHVPLWQTLTGLALLAATTYAVVLLAARFFRVENLLSNRAFDWHRLAQQLASVGLARR